MKPTNVMPQGTPDSTSPFQVAPAPGAGGLPVLMIVCAVVVIGGVLWWASQSMNSEVATSMPTFTPRASVAPTPAIDSDLQADFDGAAINDTDAQFQQIDQDLNSL